MTVRSILSRGGRAWQRRAARWFGRRMFTMPEGRPIISFTFDDFPRSALSLGAAILERQGVRATFYAALGLSGQRNECGELFTSGQLTELTLRGHELGCHTYHHCPAWETSSERYEKSVIENRRALSELLPGTEFRTHSYPISYPRPETKDRVAKYFTCCRGGGQTFNSGGIDLNYLAAFFLEQSVGRPEFIRQTIVENTAAGGWLIFATHDVCENPTRFGCPPRLFREIVTFAANSGAEILPVAQAFEMLQTRKRSRS